MHGADFVVEDDAVVVTVEEGVRRVRVEAVEPSTGRWHVVAIAHVDGQAGIVKIRIPAGLTLEDIRISTSVSDPLPSSAYLRQQVYKPSSGQESGSSTWYAFADGPAVDAEGRTGSPTIEESDIWKFRGDRLYFFNNRRGLQIIDLAKPDEPQLRGVLPLAGSGEQMYLFGDNHVVLVLSNYANGAGALVIDVSDPEAPAVVAEIPSDGAYMDSRLIGDTLFLVGVSYGGNYVDGIWESSYGSVVSAWNLSSPASPNLHARNAFSGAAMALQASDEVLMIPTHGYYRKWVPSSPGTPPPSTPLGSPPDDPPPGNPPALADIGQNADGYWSTEHVYDVKVLFLNGPMLESNPLQYPHTVVDTASTVADKFKLAYRRGVLTTISGSGWGGEGAILENWDLGSWISSYSNVAGAPKRIGSLRLAPGETTFGTRFDGDRVYIVTFLRVDPLWVVDNSDPANPTIYSELEAPGWSTYLEPMGDRLLAVGVENQFVTVSLFDVADPSNISQLARIKLGDLQRGSWSEAVYDEKAVTVLQEEGLILLPFQSWTSDGYVNAMQLVDLLPDTLVKRGAIEHDDAARRATTFKNHLVSISNGQLFVVDASNRDHPVVVAQLELSWAVDHVLAYGDHLLQLSSGQLGVFPYSGRASNSVLRVTSQDATDIVLARLEIDGTIDGAALKGGHLHLVISGLKANGAEDDAVGYKQELQHVVVDVSDPLAPKVVGKATLGLADSYGVSSFSPMWLEDGVLCWRPAGGDNGLMIPYDWMISVRGFAPWGVSASVVATVDLSDPASPELLDFEDLQISQMGDVYYSRQIFVADGTDIYRTVQSYQWVDGDYLSTQYLQQIDLGNPSDISVGRWVSMPISTLLSVESVNGATFLYTHTSRNYRDDQNVWQYENLLHALAYDGASVFPLHSVEAPHAIACEPGVFVSVGMDGGNSVVTVLEYDFTNGFTVASWSQPGGFHSATYASDGYSILYSQTHAAALDLRQPLNPQLAGSVRIGDSWWGLVGAPAVLPDEVIFVPGGYSVYRIVLESAPQGARALLAAYEQAEDWAPYSGSITLESAAESGATGALANGVWLFRPEGYQPLLEDAEDLGDATFRSAWFGLFWDTYYPWIYHDEFGWIYPVAMAQDSFWAHLGDLGWVYTASKAFPWLYAAESDDWVAYAIGSGSKGATRWYYSINNEDWFYVVP